MPHPELARVVAATVFFLIAALLIWRRTRRR